MDELRDGPEWGWCQIAGCHEPAIPCWRGTSRYPDEPDALLCADHCLEYDYCHGCGHDYDFPPGDEAGYPDHYDGLCSTCRRELAEQEADDRAIFWYYHGGRG